VSVFVQGRVLQCSTLVYIPEMTQPHLALVLAFDGSASVTYDNFGLIASATARALRDPVVAEGLIAGNSLCCLLLWSAATAQEVLVEWTRIDGTAALEAFARQVEDVPRLVPAGTTAIGAALEACEKLLAQAPAMRQVIDIAGDGASNEGPPPGPIRDRLVEAGVTINGLCVLHEEPDLVASYTSDVIGGFGSFALQCQDYDGFEKAMRQKLRQEVV